jgi:hypothetical protein
MCFGKQTSMALQVRLGINHRYISIASSHAHDAIDMLGYEMYIDMMTTMLTSMPSLIKTVRRYQLSKPDVLIYISSNIEILAISSA